VALREYRDSAGTEWRVWPVIPGAMTGRAILEEMPEELRHGWLCFQSRREKRRLCPMPRSWEQRSDEELDVLRRAAEVVPASN
jgi:hypothetical protein